MKKLFLDTETRSGNAIKDGTYKYAEDASVLLLATAIDDEPVQVTDLANGEVIPETVAAALNDPDTEIWCHNSQFDRVILSRIFPTVADPARWIDTMVVAETLAIPPSLDSLSEYLELPLRIRKDKSGKKHIDMFTRLQNREKKTEPYFLNKADKPAEWEAFKSYAGIDVEALRGLSKKLPYWNYNAAVRSQFNLDQIINDRGFCIDTELAKSAIKIANKIKDNSDTTVRNLTNGRVQTVNQCQKLMVEVTSRYGYYLKDFSNSTLEAILDDENLPEELRGLINARLAAGKASVKKYEAVLKCVSKDGRLRGCLKFWGATRTGRYSGKNFQPQNLPRSSMTPEQIEEAIASIKDGTLIDKYDAPMAVLSECIRGLIIPSDGMKFCVADYSNIENRVLAFVAGAGWKIKDFEEHDKYAELSELERDSVKRKKYEDLAKSKDLYRVAYAKISGKDPKDVTKDERQIGKAMELGLGYGGGVSAFLRFGSSIDLEKLADVVESTVGEQFLNEAKNQYQWFADNDKTYGLEKRIFIAIDALKRSWRSANSDIVNLWEELGQACIDVITDKESKVQVGCLTVDWEDNFLRIKLPSGRYIPYSCARCINGELILGGTKYGKFEYTRAYGAMVVQNVTQALARDLIAGCMQAVEDAGYQIVFHCHDELVTEAPDNDSYSYKGLAEIMTRTPDWAVGLPLDADGYDSYRYRK